MLVTGLLMVGEVEGGSLNERGTFSETLLGVSTIYAREQRVLLWKRTGCWVTMPLTRVGAPKTSEWQAWK